MIEKNRWGEFEIECDQCGARATIDTGDDWMLMINELRRRGWESLKIDEGGWEHYCPDCAA